MRRALWYPAAVAAGLLAVALQAGCSDADMPDDELHPVANEPPATVLPAREALSGADIPTIDPHTMDDAEIGAVVDAADLCQFRYTSSSKPVLAFGNAEGAVGVVKLNGHLVALEATDSEDAIVLIDDPVRLTLTPHEGSNPAFTDLREATLIFEIGDRLRAGYRGYYGCGET